MYEALALLAAGVLLGLGIEVARHALEAARWALAELVHAIRWHVYRPLVRRYYLARLERDPSTRIYRHIAMQRHPAGKGRGETHGHTLS